MKKDISSLFADSPVVGGSNGTFLKLAQEQPDNVQFAQDFSNIAFQFLQDRAPALMKYIVGFEVVDRSDNGTRAVGIFGFKIDGNYYYVPAFFMNSQVKGINSILSKRTNSFVPLTEQWVNYIINRKANELGKEAPGGKDNDPSQFENPNFDFLQRPTVGPLGGPAFSGTAVGYKAASAEDEPWTYKQAWDAICDGIEKMAAEDVEFRKAFAGFYLSISGTRSPLQKEASSPIQDFLAKVGGPKAEISFMESLKNVKMANAALEFYTGPAAFHVDKYTKDCYAIKKLAQEISEKTPKVKVTSTPGNEEEAREIVEDGFIIRDEREPERKSDVIETDYEKNFQNPDRPGVYNVLVNGGMTAKAYITYMDSTVTPDAKKFMGVYFPDNKQIIYAKPRDILCEGGAIGSPEEFYNKAKSVIDCELHKSYVFIDKTGRAFPEFHISNTRRVRGERPVLNGSFSTYRLDSNNDYTHNPSGDFDNHWRDDYFHHIDGSPKINEMWISSVELAEFEGRPKQSAGSVILPKDWKAIRVLGEYEEESTGDMRAAEPVSSDEKPKRKVYHLAGLDSLSLELRKEGAAKLEVRSDDGQEYYFSFDGGHFTRPVGYKQACIDLVTRLGIQPKDAKSLLKKASVERKHKVLVKMGQFVGVSTQMPREQTPEVDPYTGIPVFASPYYDDSRMPFYGNDTSVSDDNAPGENIGGDIQRQSQEGGEAEMDPEAAMLAQNAAQLGQKDVFDKAAIGGLAKVYDTGAVIDSYLPEFMQSLDRVGRVLFLYYWKHNDFVSRYGTDDVIEMEDVLKNVFNNLGKLTLDLKRKAIGGGDNQSGEDII